MGTLCRSVHAHLLGLVVWLISFYQIFEAAEIKTEIGAALGVQTNSLKVFDHLGVSRDNLNGVPWGGVCFRIFLEAD